MKNSKKKKWIKPRHTFYRKLINGVLRFYVKIKYGFTPDYFKGDKKRQYLVLSNHQTPLDQFFITMSFKKNFYCVASEDLFSAGIKSRFMEHAIAPIPIKKQTSDFIAVKKCLSVVKEGGSLILFPEGNRTYSGKTEHINPSVAKLIKLVKLPVIIYNISGGYGVNPRWSNFIRKGKMKAYVKRIIEYEEYSTLSDEELYTLIKKELFVNDCSVNENYYTKKNAENLERLIYVCPNCGLSRFTSSKSTLKCEKCGLQAEYLPNKTFKSKTANFPFKFVNDWYEYQKSFINRLELLNENENLLYTDNANVFKVEIYKNKKLIYKNSEIKLFRNKIEFGLKNERIICLFEKIKAVTVLGRNKLNVYSDNEVYQFKGDKSFNAIKYVHIFNRFQNIIKGDVNGEFLGL